jgi:hypothetical protein
MLVPHKAQISLWVECLVIPNVYKWKMCMLGIIGNLVKNVIHLLRPNFFPQKFIFFQAIQTTNKQHVLGLKNI